MNLIDIIKYGLVRNKFDGLYHSGCCACLVSDLSPGDCVGNDCRGGYKHTHSVTGEWVINDSMDVLNNDEIQVIINEQ